MHGYLWSKEAYGAILFATAVSATCRSPTRSPSRAYRPCSWRWRARCWRRRRPSPEPFDGFDPADLEGSIDRLVDFNRRSAKTHSGIYRDLAVRHRKTEVDAMLATLDGPLVRHTLLLIHAIEDGRRICQRANLDLLAAYERLERARPAAERRDRRGGGAQPGRVRPAAGAVRSRSRTTSTSPAR